MKLNTNSNTYILAYASLLVIAVAFVLAYFSQALKPIQDKNVALDKKKQIIAALNIRDVNDNQVEEYYNKLVEADEIINEKNEVLSAGKPGGENDGFKLNGGDFKAGKLALFVCNVDGQKKYVMPVYGMGLWGGISGYIAINADKETIYGVYFNHEGETALSVCKKVDNPATQVDGVSGATLTCDGVTRMIHEGLGKYLVFLKDK